MKEQAFRIAKSLSSKTRLEIIDALSQGMEHPEEVAVHLGIKRQSVDKHLMLLHNLGIVERSAVFPPEGRPKIVYSLTEEGKALLKDMDAVADRHTKRMKGRYLSEKRVLDATLAEGELSEDVYLRKLGALKRRYGVS